MIKITLDGQWLLGKKKSKEPESIFFHKEGFETDLKQKLIPTPFSVIGFECCSAAKCYICEHTTPYFPAHKPRESEWATNAVPGMIAWLLCRSVYPVCSALGSLCGFRLGRPWSRLAVGTAAPPCSAGTLRGRSPGRRPAAWAQLAPKHLERVIGGTLAFRVQINHEMQMPFHLTLGVSQDLILVFEPSPL